jgi:hypothetical protein
MIRWHNWLQVAAASNSAADLPLAPGAKRRDVAVDAIEVIFGNLLLLLVELAAIFLAVILLLLQANLMLRLVKRLNWRRGLDGTPSRESPAGPSYLAGVSEKKEG